MFLAYEYGSHRFRPAVMAVAPLAGLLCEVAYRVCFVEEEVAHWSVSTNNQKMRVRCRVCLFCIHKLSRFLSHVDI